MDLRPLGGPASHTASLGAAGSPASSRTPGGSLTPGGPSAAIAVLCAGVLESARWKARPRPAPRRGIAARGGPRGVDEEAAGQWPPLESARQGLGGTLEGFTRLRGSMWRARCGPSRPGERRTRSANRTQSLPRALAAPAAPVAPTHNPSGQGVTRLLHESPNFLGHTAAFGETRACRLNPRRPMATRRSAPPAAKPPSRAKRRKASPDHQAPAPPCRQSWLRAALSCYSGRV